MTQIKNTPGRSDSDDPKHKMVFYAITIKHNTNGLMEKQYRLLIEDYLDGFPHDIVESFFEKDKKGKLHYHGVFIAKRGLRYRSLFKKGMHVYIRRAYNLKGWKSYIAKDTNLTFIARKEQKEYEELALRKYLFI